MGRVRGERAGALLGDSEIIPLIIEIIILPAGQIQHFQTVQKLHLYTCSIFPLCFA